MLKQQKRLFGFAAAVADQFALVASFCIAYWIHSRTGRLEELHNYTWILLVAIPVWYFLMSIFGMHKSMRTCPYTFILVSLAKVQFIGGLVLTSTIYFVDPKGFSRGLVAYFLGVSYLVIGMEKILLKAGLSLIRRRGYNFRNILVVGDNPKAHEFIHIIEQHDSWGLRIVGVLRTDRDKAKGDVEGYKVLGSIEDVGDVCKRITVDEVVFCLPKDYLPRVENYFLEVSQLGITYRMVLDFEAHSYLRRELTFFHEQIPMLSFYYGKLDANSLFLKRCMDVAGAVLGLVITGVLLPVIAAAIKLDSKGPVFFGQIRVGENGRIFRCWKFRSMCRNAEEQKEQLRGRNEMGGALFKINGDPRITGVGRFLRRTSLDELPQFWNVLKGEMSLVGTRPPTPDEVLQYQSWHRKRICIKPGITGLWQVSGRNQISNFDQVAKLDIDYIEKWSFWLDLKILTKTVGKVFFQWDGV